MYLNNRATLIGFLGKDAEVRNTRNETPFTVLSLATKRSWKDRETGERQSQTTWHRRIVWGKLGEFASTLTKGAYLQTNTAAAKLCTMIVQSSRQRGCLGLSGGSPNQ